MGDEASHNINLPASLYILHAFLNQLSRKDKRVRYNLMRTVQHYWIKSMQELEFNHATNSNIFNFK